MNKTMLGIMTVFLLFVAAGFASATLSVSGSTTIALGGPSQERDQSVTGSITITNTGASPDVGIIASSNAASKYNITFSNVPGSLGPGASATINVQGYVPMDQDAGTATLGSYTISAGAGNAVSGPITLQARNNLQVRTAEAIVTHADNTEDNYNIKNGGDNIDVKPGDNVRVEIKVRNDGPKDVDFDDVSASIDSRGDSSISEDDSFSNLRQADSDTLIMEFTIPDDAESDDTATITIEGTDQNGAKHTIIWNADINLDRPSHEIDITDLSISPESVSCTAASKTTASVTIKNAGLRDESQVTLEVKARDLNYFKRLISIQLDQDRKTTKTFDIPLGQIPAGEYLIEATTYYSNSQQSDNKAVSLSVKACPTTPTVKNTTKQDSGSGSDVSGLPQTPFTSPPYVGTTAKTSGISNDVVYLAVLVLAGILMITGIIVLIVKFLV